jgi:hypothetical protein
METTRSKDRTSRGSSSLRSSRRLAVRQVRAIRSKRLSIALKSHAQPFAHVTSDFAKTCDFRCYLRNIRRSAQLHLMASCSVLAVPRTVPPSYMLSSDLARAPSPDGPISVSNYAH